MADASAIQFLFNRIGELVKQRSNLTAEAWKETEQLTIDLEYFNTFLKFASTMKDTDQRQRESIRQIRDVVYDAEDALDDLVTQTASVKSRSLFSRISGDVVKLNRHITERVRTLRKNVESVYGDRWNLDMVSSSNIGGGADDKSEVSQATEEDIVGFEKETDIIIGYLLEETPRLDIISIVGMPGLGKSTLAGKIFRDQRIEYKFPKRLWVSVSKFTPTDVFLSILREFESTTEEMRTMKEHKLAKRARDFLREAKFLIVMDGVWTIEDWSIISAALPTTNHGGKVLITSRDNAVAKHVNPLRKPYRLGFFSYDDSVNLLQCEVFGEPRWESEIEYYGRQIASKCNGLPLAIVVIGGLIARKLSSNVDHARKLNTWRKFSERVSEYLLNDPDRTIEKVFSTSYDRLPHHLRPCFLYFGMFPSDMEIPASKLFLMWIAEGFVQENSGFTLEETAESYLDELIIRNLVMIRRRSSNGKAKTCQVHDLLSAFCKNQAGQQNENFLEEITNSTEGVLTPAVIDDRNYRRLCIHSHFAQFLASKPSGQKVRSLICFSKEDLTLEEDQVSAILSGFKLLRVLDVKPAKFNTIAADMYKLLHLRYARLSLNSAVLPKGFSKLWNMQTLIVDTSERVLEIKADIWKMRHLRHLKTNAIAMLPKPTNAAASKDESNIQILGAISPESCTDEALERACNLRRLSIRGKLEILISSERTEASFDHMAKLTKLEKLKLENDVYPAASSEGPLPRLPPADKFPPNLWILTLSGTLLKWSEMKVLACLRNLEVLKLKQGAFMGKKWETANDGFPSLRALFIGETDLEFWKMTAGTFPNLMQLDLHKCENLQEVPVEFAENPTLSVLNLFVCQKAAPSAEEIRRKKMEADATAEFKLSIYSSINN